MTNAAYKRGYDLIDWSKPLPKIDKPRIAPARGAFPCPRIATDSMEPTEHIDGKFYDSKSQFRAVTKAHGCIEIGNDPARHKPIQKPKPDVKARKQAVQKAIAQAGL